jgi:adenylate cyclase
VPTCGFQISLAVNLQPRLDTSPDPEQNPLWNGTEGLMGPQEHRVERRLAAIFAADVAGYSHLMSQDEVRTLQALTAHREIMDHLIAEHGGRIVNLDSELW